MKPITLVLLVLTLLSFSAGLFFYFSGDKNTGGDGLSGFWPMVISIVLLLVCLVAFLLSYAAPQFSPSISKAMSAMAIGLPVLGVLGIIVTLFFFNRSYMSDYQDTINREKALLTNKTFTDSTLAVRFQHVSGVDSGNSLPEMIVTPTIEGDKIIVPCRVDYLPADVLLMVRKPDGVSMLDYLKTQASTNDSIKDCSIEKVKTESFTKLHNKSEVYGITSAVDGFACQTQWAKHFGLSTEMGTHLIYFISVPEKHDRFWAVFIQSPYMSISAVKENMTDHDDRDNRWYHSLEIIL